MNARVWLLLRDYARRTGGAWLMVAFVQIIQTVTFWAAGIANTPLLATVIASFAYAYTSRKPRGVLEILPLTPVEAALFRWWSSFALPALVILGCTWVSALLSASKDWPIPAESLLEATVIAVIAVLAWLPRVEARIRSTLFWGVAAAAGLIGLPVGALNRPLLLLLGVASVGLSIVTSARPSIGTRARRSTQSRDQPLGKAVSLASPAPSAPFAGWLRGWRVLLVEVGRTTALVSATALAATAVLHMALAPRMLPGFHGAVTWLFVSVVAAATCLPMRRWIEAVSSLRILPLEGRWLAWIVYCTLMTPGVITCLVLIGAQWLSPRIGLDIPSYMLFVFLLAPITLVRWDLPRETQPILQVWAPAVQQAVWPMWVGSFCALRGVPFMPAWFLLYLAIAAACIVFAGYKALLAGIRSPASLEVDGGVLPGRA